MEHRYPVYGWPLVNQVEIEFANPIIRKSWPMMWYTGGVVRITQNLLASIGFGTVGQKGVLPAVMSRSIAGIRCSRMSAHNARRGESTGKRMIA